MFLVQCIKNCLSLWPRYFKHVQILSWQAKLKCFKFLKQNFFHNIDEDRYGTSQNTNFAFQKANNQYVQSIEEFLEHNDSKMFIGSIRGQIVK